jgi:AbrB family looped-hinge helix DNA binding protein
MAFKVEALIPVDHRGQMVLPKELRDKAKIRAGDKLAVVTWDQGDEACCLTLIKADSLTEMVKELLGPLVREIRSTGREDEK